jgi:phosphoesterase RecJ-like protein
MLDNPSYLEPMDEVSEEVIRNSLVITVDTSTNARSDDQSFLLGKQILKIDHHLRSEEVTPYAYVDPEASSVCEIITRMAMELGWIVSQRAAELLFGGMLTDSCRLSIPNVTGDTFRAAAFLADQLIDISWVNRCVFDNDIEGFKAGVAFENKIQFADDLAYFRTSINDMHEFGLTDGEIKDYVDLMANIKGVDKYAVFAQMENGNYTVSLRSHTASVVHIANKYGGGGHALACGIPEVTAEQVEEIIDLLIKAR